MQQTTYGQAELLLKTSNVQPHQFQPNFLLHVPMELSLLDGILFLVLITMRSELTTNKMFQEIARTTKMAAPKLVVGIVARQIF